MKKDLTKKEAFLKRIKSNTDNDTVDFLGLPEDNTVDYIGKYEDNTEDVI